MATTVLMTAEESAPDSEVHGPALVVEARSAGERASTLWRKVVGHLNAGVKVVCVVDLERRTVTVSTQDEYARVLTVADELTLPEVFADFRVPVRAFFV